MNCLSLFRDFPKADIWFVILLRRARRSGLQDFLTKMASLYELHVYTAGTRSYANAICTCIDPTGKFFSERILSRNESGSASTKSLKRLFPTDESMVVVIDDRWEVWAHGRNLVKVIPCKLGYLDVLSGRSRGLIRKLNVRRCVLPEHGGYQFGLRRT